MFGFYDASREQSATGNGCFFIEENLQSVYFNNKIYRGDLNHGKVL